MTHDYKSTNKFNDSVALRAQLLIDALIGDMNPSNPDGDVWINVSQVAIIKVRIEKLQDAINHATPTEDMSASIKLDIEEIIKRECPGTDENDIHYAIALRGAYKYYSNISYMEALLVKQNQARQAYAIYGPSHTNTAKSAIIGEMIKKLNTMEEPGLT